MRGPRRVEAPRPNATGLRDLVFDAKPLGSHGRLSGGIGTLRRSGLVETSLGSPDLGL
jgi:hypothetical protein